MEFAGLSVIQKGATSKPESVAKGFFILVNKPFGWTSFDVVAKCRGIFRKWSGVKKLKVGHAGTLDPAATGLLVLAVGRAATKEIDKIQALSKTYSGTMKLGATTPSFDAETDEDSQFSVSHITTELLENALLKLRGKIDQVPPSYSAVKIDGQRSYKLARSGQDVRHEPRPVEIYNFEAKLEDGMSIVFSVQCSKGTYIRSLARDLGSLLHSGAYLTSLQRIAIGEFQLKNAYTPDEVSKLFGNSLQP
jgi:tRNA pseudouridine55 synthase